MLTLFPDERIVSRSFDGSIVLTTHRISYEYESSGKSYNQSILLEHVTSCKDYCNQSVISLIAGGALLILGLSAVYGDRIEAASALIVLAIACGIYYWMSRKSYIVISSPDTKMMINTNGMRKELVFVFINRIEQTKHARLVKLSRAELIR